MCVVVGGTCQDGCQLGRLGQFPCSPHRHIAPVEASPALCEHQQIQSSTPFLVVLLEVPARIGHKPAYLAGQKHLSEDVSAVIQTVASLIVPHAQRDAVLCIP